MPCSPQTHLNDEGRSQGPDPASSEEISAMYDPCQERLVAHPIDGGNVNAVSDGVGALDGAPGIKLGLSFRATIRR